MWLIEDITIQINTTVDRLALLRLQNHSDLGCDVEVIYIYSLVDEQINYPLKSGKVLYIGEAMRHEEPTGKRFQHIAASQSEGNNYVSNYTLTQYYHLGKKLNLKIYRVSSDRENVEKQLLSYHLYKYGSKPIANGSTGEYCTSSYLKKLKSDFDLYGGMNII